MNTKSELRELGIQHTRQRASILELLKSSKTPITINEIKEGLDVDIDLSTIYRTLLLFEEKNLIKKTILQDPLENVYDYNRQIHKHHLICLKCKKIVNIDDCPLSDYEARVAKNTGFIIQNHQLELYGICPECQI